LHRLIKQFFFQEKLFTNLHFHPRICCVALLDCGNSQLKKETVADIKKSFKQTDSISNILNSNNKMKIWVKFEVLILNVLVDLMCSKDKRYPLGAF
jgi:hypothetical protein